MPDIANNERVEVEAAHLQNQDTSVAFKQLMHTITNLAMDKLRLVTKLVELNIPTWSVEVSGSPALKGAPTLRTGGNKDNTSSTFFSLSLSARSCHSRSHVRTHQSV